MSYQQQELRGRWNSRKDTRPLAPLMHISPHGNTHMLKWLIVLEVNRQLLYYERRDEVVLAKLNFVVRLAYGLLVRVRLDRAGRQQNLAILEHIVVISCLSTRECRSHQCSCGETLPLQVSPVARIPS